MSAVDEVVVEALVIILVVAACRWFNRRRGAGAPANPLPGPPDPYTLAWLRGGPTAVLELAAYDLVRGDHLALVPAGSAGPAGPAGGAHALTPLLAPLPTRVGEDALPEAARRLLHLVTAACDRPRLAGFALDLAPCFDAIDRTLRADGLLLTPAQRLAGWAVTLFGMAVVLGVTFWQLQGGRAEAQGSEVALASLAAIGVAALRLLGAPEPRLSPRGRAYVLRLGCERALAAAALRGERRWIPAAAGGRDPESPPAPAPGLLEVALTGLPVLNGTAYAALVALLEPASVAPGPVIVQDATDEDYGQDRREQDGGAQR
jgi:uncharacterized protein (TIGR04222 family)